MYDEIFVKIWSFFPRQQAKLLKMAHLTSPVKFLWRSCDWFTCEVANRQADWQMSGKRYPLCGCYCCSWM